MRAGNRSGTVRVSAGPRRDKALLEMLDSDGRCVEVGLSVEELHTLAQVLRRVALALTAEQMRDETTQR